MTTISAPTTTTKEEPLTREDPHRFALFPIRHPLMWRLYKLSAAMHWSADEIDMSKDAKDFGKLSENEQQFLLKILGFFAVADGMVTENLAARMLSLIQMPEARAFYSFQILNEQVHAETYGRLIETYVKDLAKRRELFEAMKTMPAIQAKGNWFLERVHSERLSLAERLLAAAIMEGMFFQVMSHFVRVLLRVTQASFCGIFWFNHQKFIDTQFGTRATPQLPGLFQSNALIARDEGQHFLASCYLYRQFIVNKLPVPKVHEILQSAVKLEEDFVHDALPHKLVGMNAQDMIKYVHFVANKVCEYVEVPPLYKEASNPFSFMDELVLVRRGNFFEIQVTEYRQKMNIPPETDVHTVVDAVDVIAPGGPGSSATTTMRTTPAAAAVAQPSSHPNDFRTDLED